VKCPLRNIWWILPTVSSEAVELRSNRRGNLGVRFKVPPAPNAAAVGHFSVIFEKPPVAFEAQNIGIKSPIIEAEFEITRSSTTTLSAVASASIGSDRSRSDGNGEMR
jgi:hypothetical protein